MQSPPGGQAVRLFGRVVTVFFECCYHPRVQLKGANLPCSLVTRLEEDMHSGTYIFYKFKKPVQKTKIVIIINKIKMNDLHCVCVPY